MAAGVKQRVKEGDKKPTRYYSSKQEKNVAKNIGGRQTSNSGATDFSKGDVRTKKWLLECKTKTSPSQQITVHKEWITKNRQEALFMGKPYSAVAFSFGPGEENHYIIDEDLFIKLCEVLENE